MPELQTYWWVLHRSCCMFTCKLWPLNFPAYPPWWLRGQYLTLPPATLSSVTHSSHSIQTAGYPNKGDRRGAARAFHLRTHNTSSHAHKHTLKTDSACRGAAWSLTGALCSSVSQPLGPEDTFSQRDWLPERRDSHGSEILMPGGHLEHADLLTSPLHS